MIVHVFPSYPAGTGRPLATYVLDLKHEHSGEHLGPYVRDPGKHKIEWDRSVNINADSPAAAISAIEEYNAQNTRKHSKSRWVHIVVSFPRGECPTRAQMEIIEDRVMASIGFGDHPRISALHKPDGKEVDNWHLHIAVSRIDPTTHKAEHPWRNHFALQAEAARLENDLGLRQERKTLLARERYEIEQRRAIVLNRSRPMPTVDELAHEIAHRTGGHQHKQQNGWMVRCPAHDDREASLSIREGRTQPLVHCFAGCSQEKVIGALQQMGVWPERGEYRRPDPSAVVQRKREETTKQIQARAWEQLLDRHPDLPAEARHFVDLKPLQHAAAVPSEKTTDLERINAKLRQGPNLEPLRQPLPLTPEFRTADRLDRAHRADRAARELRPEFGEQLRALRDTARLPTNSSEASHVDRLRRRSDTLTVEGIARELSPAYAAASFAVSKSRNVLQQAMSDLRRAYAVKERAELQIRERTEEMGPMRRAMHVRWTPHMTLPQKALYRVARDTQLNEYERYRGGAIKKIRALTPEVRGAQATVKTWETTAIREFEAIQPAAEAELHRRQAAEAEEARFGFKNTPELKKGRSLSL